MAENASTPEEIGKEAAETADECFAQAQGHWDQSALLARQGEAAPAVVLALHALSLEISAGVSVICSVLAKLEHAKAEWVTEK